MDGVFKDTTNLTKWTIRFLYLQVGVVVLSIITGALEYQLLSDINNGIYHPDSDYELNDTRVGLSALAFVFVFFITAFMILRWIYLTSQNSHLISSDTMEDSPGWAVGWYFVPIANLWKPYQAMKEIWRVNVSDTTPSIFPWWWLFWILTSYLGNLSAQASLFWDSENNLIQSNMFYLLSDITNIPLCLIFITIMNQIYQSQKLKVEQKETTKDADFD